MLKTSRAWGLAPFTLALMAVPTSAQTLVKDINPNPPDDLGGTAPNQFAFAGGLTFFAGTGEGTGRELFVSDGTQNGSSIVVDLLEGIPSSNPTAITALGNEVFFLATGPDGKKMYRSDGTAEGTVPFESSSFGTPTNIDENDGRLYFTAPDNVNLFLNRTWVSDGTPEGTFMLLSDNTFSSGLGDGDGPYYYFEGDPGELWRTDGTVAGTVQIAALNNITELDAENGTLWFFDKITYEGGSPPPDWDLWRSDGTVAGTVRVKELGNLKPKKLTANDSGAIFTGVISSNNVEPWVSDGTEAGTALLLDLNPGSASADPEDFVGLGDSFFFTAITPGLGREVWVTDGTAGGSFVLTDGHTGFSGNTGPGDLTALGDEVFFRSTGPFGNDPGSELWKTDGTVFGTTLVADLNTEGDSAPSNLTSDGTRIWFAAYADGIGSEVFAADTNGAQLIADLAPNIISSPTEMQFIEELNGRLFFLADNGTDGMEPWISDGTEEGTVQLADINPGFQGIEVQSHAVFDEWLYFSAQFNLDWQLWRTDGSPDGTVHLIPGVQAFWLATSNNKLWFAGDDPVNGREPWVLESKFGTPHLVKDLTPGDSYCRQFTPIGNVTVFTAETEGRGTEPWVTDGTEEGTFLLADVQPGPDGSSPGGFVEHQGLLYFVARTDFSTNIWSTDGTKEGTQLRLVVETELGVDYPSNLTPLGDLIYFLADTDVAFGFDPATDTGFPLGVADIDHGGLVPVGERLLLIQDDQATLLGYDGTPGVFETLKTLPGSFPYYIYVEPLGDIAFVQAGAELLTTDGTLAGTVLATELVPFPINELGVGDLDATAVGSDTRVLVGGYDTTNGFELWVSDGTGEGSFVLADIDPGLSNSYPAGYFRAGDNVYFAADDGVVGRELHAIPFGQTGGYVSESFGTVCPMTTGHTPRMDTTGDAVVGTANYSIEYDGAPAGSTGLLFYSPGLGVGTLGGGCALYFAAPYYLYPGFALTDGAGHGELPVPVPNDPGLAGLALYFQYLISDPGGLIYGIMAPTDGLEVVLGP